MSTQVTFKNLISGAKETFTARISYLPTIIETVDNINTIMGCHQIVLYDVTPLILHVNVKSNPEAHLMIENQMRSQEYDELQYHKFDTTFIHNDVEHFCNGCIISEYINLDDDTSISISILIDRLKYCPTTQTGKAA
jgi:hypothetical protein